MSFAKKLRPALGRELRHRAHGDAEPVRVAQLPVHPGLGVRVQLVRRDLARGQHHLPVPVVHIVPVHVRVLEVVVRPDQLDLLVHVQHLAVVPQPDIVYRLEVLAHHLRRQPWVHRVELLRNPVQAEPLAGELDVARDVRRLPRELGRPHPEPLRRVRPNDPQQQGKHNEQRHRAHEQPYPAQVRVDQDQHTARYGHYRQDHQRVLPDVQVRVRRAKHHRLVRQQQPPPVEPQPGAYDHHDQRAHYRHLQLDPGRDLQPYAAEAEVDEVDP